MKKILFVLLVVGISMNASADTISSVLTKKPIKLFATAEETMPLREITSEELSPFLPLPVIAEVDERVKLTIDKKAVWAPSMAFKINRDCKTIARVSPKSTRDTAAIRGIGEEGGCTK